MRRRPFRLLVLFVALAGSCAQAAEPNRNPPAAMADASSFEGMWLGEIIAPNTRTPFGLAFTRAKEELLVSVYFPEMFLYGVNFGPAEIRDNTFKLPSLNLALTLEGNSLSGTFAPAQLAVKLNRGGVFHDELPPVEAPAAPAPTWSHDLGSPAWASPIEFGGTVYVGTTDGAFHAVRASDGVAVWKWQGLHPLHGEALANEESVYFVDDQRDLVCLARATGTLTWRLPLHDAALAGGAVPENETFNHRTPSPVIDTKGIIYVGSTDGGVYAVRANTGRKLWRHDAKTKIHAPILLRGDDAIVAGYDGSVITLNRRTRKETARTKLGGALVSAPVLSGRHIVLGSRDYLLHGLEGASLKSVWQNTYWFSWIESAPRVFDGLLYIGGSDYRRVSAIDPSNGKVLWATDVQGLSWGTPLVSADTVYAGTLGQMLKGTVIQHRGSIVALDRTSGAVKWRYAAPVPDGAPFAGFAGSLIFAGPNVIGARIDGTLVALRAKL